MIIKINIFRGDLSGISAKTATLIARACNNFTLGAMSTAALLLIQPSNPKAVHWKNKSTKLAKRHVVKLYDKVIYCLGTVLPF